MCVRGRERGSRLWSWEVGVKSQLDRTGTPWGRTLPVTRLKGRVSYTYAQLKTERAGDRSSGGGGGLMRGPKSGMYTLVYLVRPGDMFS